MSAFLTLMWLVTGILVLCFSPEITKLHYGLIWLCLMICLFERCI